MTSINLKTKVFTRAVVKTKVNAPFPSQVSGKFFIEVEKEDGVFSITPDYRLLPGLTSYDPSQFIVAVQKADGSWKTVTLASLQTNMTPVRIVTESGDITVGVNDRLLIMNRTMNESPSNITLPVASLKNGGVKIVDWKGNASAYPHDVYLSESEKFNAAQTVWHINGDGASIVCDPIPGLGYAI